MVGMIGSVYSLVCLSMGRCILVTFTQSKYLKLVKKIRHVIITMISIWLLGFMFSLPALFSLTLDESIDGSYACGSKWGEEQANYFFLIKFIFIFIIPLAIILVSSFKLLLFLKKSKNKLNLSEQYTVVKKHNLGLNRSKNKIKQGRVSIYKHKKRNVQKRAVKMVLSIVVLFVIQWTPIWFCEIFLTNYSQYIQLINIMATVFSHSNSISNPLVYIVLSHKFPFIDFLRRFFKCAKNPIIV